MAIELHKFMIDIMKSVKKDHDVLDEGNSFELNDDDGFILKGTIFDKWSPEIETLRDFTIEVKMGERYERPRRNLVVCPDEDVHKEKDEEEA